VVNRAISASTTSTQTTPMAHALATHSSDVMSSLPQSSVGVNVSIPGKLPGAGLHGHWLVAPHPAESPFAVAEQFEFVCVMLLDGGAVADADQNGVR
jgi:hypothetical protein